MFVNVIPAGLLEVLLFAALLGSFFFVLQRVRHRRSFLSKLTSSADLPVLLSECRCQVTIQRLFRDRDQDAILADIRIGDRRLVICLSDYLASELIYTSAQHAPLLLCIYGLAALTAPQETEQPLDEVTSAAVADNIDFVASGPLLNDYSVRGKIASYRRTALDDMPVDVYRLYTPKTFEFDVAVEVQPNTKPFGVDSDVAGTVRFYGYVASESTADPAVNVQACV